MAEYRLTTDSNSVVRTVDGNWIVAENMSAWAEYQAWLKAGNVPDPYVRDAASATFDAQQKAIADDVDRKDLLSKLQGATPAQIKTYVANNVNNLADAKLLLAKILLILSK